MKEMSYILSNVGPTSLVVMDELGRGTSTEEGAALCWAIAEDLADKNRTTAFSVLATHFTLLTRLEKLYPNVVK